MKRIIVLAMSIIMAVNVPCMTYAQECSSHATVSEDSVNEIPMNKLETSEFTFDASEFTVDAGASDDLDVASLYPYSYNENAENNTSLMAHNFYYDPKLSLFSGKYTAYSVDVKADRDPVGTYWSTVNFSMSGGAHGYAGIQNTTSGRKAILSIWEYEKTVDGRTVTMTPERLFPDRNTSHFGNEGSGSQSIVNYPWEANHWYRVLVRCYEDSDYGHTVVEQWIQDRETMEWTLTSAFDTLQTNAYFTGNFSAFMENYNSTYCNKLRTIQLKNPYVLEYGSTTWRKVTSGTVSTDTWYGNKKGGFTFGSTDQYIWGIVCGYGADMADSGVATSKTVSVTTFDGKPYHSRQFYYEFESPVIDDFSVQDTHDGKPTLTFHYKDKSKLGSFSLSIDGTEHISETNWGKYYKSVASQVVYTPDYPLEEGSHVIEVRAADEYQNHMVNPYKSTFSITIDKTEPPKVLDPKVISTKKTLYQGGSISISPQWNGDGGSSDIEDFGILRRIKKKRYEDVTDGYGIQVEYLLDTREFVITADETARPGKYRLSVNKQVEKGVTGRGLFEFTVSKDVAGAKTTVSDKTIRKRHGKSAKLKTKPFIYTMKWSYDKKVGEYVLKKAKISGCKVRYSIVGPGGMELNDEIAKYVTVDKKGKIRVASGFIPDSDPENNRFSVQITVTPKDSGRDVVVNDLNEAIFEIVQK